MSEENVEIIRRAYEAFNRHDSMPLWGKLIPMTSGTR